MREELEQARKEKEDVSILLQRTLAEVEDLHEQNNELNGHIDKTAARSLVLSDPVSLMLSLDWQN
jgi:predicted  nucleic acid-binding Zn-ribbon protein